MEKIYWSLLFHDGICAQAKTGVINVTDNTPTMKAVSKIVDKIEDVKIYIYGQMNDAIEGRYTNLRPVRRVDGKGWAVSNVRLNEEVAYGCLAQTFKDILTSPAARPQYDFEVRVSDLLFSNVDFTGIEFHDLSVCTRKNHDIEEWKREAKGMLAATIRWAVAAHLREIKKTIEASGLSKDSGIYDFVYHSFIYSLPCVSTDKKQHDLRINKLAA